MRRILSFAIIICPLVILFQGCYTIVDLPDIAYDEYISIPDPIYPYEPPSGPIPHPPIPRPPHPHPPIIIQPIIIEQPVSTGPYKREGDIQKIRDNGNGRGNSDRNTDFNESTETRSVTNSGTNNNSSSNSDNTRGSSYSGNTRR